VRPKITSLLLRIAEPRLVELSRLQAAQNVPKGPRVVRLSVDFAHGRRDEQGLVEYFVPSLKSRHIGRERSEMLALQGERCCAAVRARACDARRKRRTYFGFQARCA